MCAKDGVIREILMEYEQALERVEANLKHGDFSEPTNAVLRARRTAYRGIIERLRGQTPEDKYHLL